MYHAQSMRVGIFSDCYFPAINGVVTSIAQQVEILRDKGHQVDLYCPRYAGEQGQELGTRRLSAVPFPFHKREQILQNIESTRSSQNLGDLSWTSIIYQNNQNLLHRSLAKLKQFF